jgi:hypothetical protein
MSAGDFQNLCDLLQQFSSLLTGECLQTSYSWMQQLSNFASIIRKEVGELRTAKRSGHAHKSTVLPLEVTEADTPLHAQQALLKCWWDALYMFEHHEWWAKLPHFVYFGCRLCILERMNSFDHNQGEEVFTALQTLNIEGGSL